MHHMVAYEKCYPKVNSQANPGWVMSGTLQFQPKIIAATFLIVRFLTFVSKLTTFFTIKPKLREITAFYSIKRPILLKKLKKRTIKKVPGGVLDISISQMKVVWCHYA